MSRCFDIAAHLGRGHDRAPDAYFEHVRLLIDRSCAATIRSARVASTAKVVDAAQLDQEYVQKPLMHRDDRLPHRTPESYPWDMLDWTQCAAVERDPARVSGAWVFRGTRVPVKALFENVEDGARVDDFLAWFPGVTRQQVEAVLQHAELSLAEA